jgi:hypothetical protein
LYLNIIQLIVGAVLSFAAALCVYPYRPQSTPVFVLLMTLGLLLCCAVFILSYLYSNAHIDQTRARYQKSIDTCRSRLKVAGK